MNQHFMYCVCLISGSYESYRCEPLFVFRNRSKAESWADAMTILVNGILTDHGRMDVDDNDVHYLDWDYSVIGSKWAKRAVRDSMLGILDCFKFSIIEINSED